MSAFFVLPAYDMFSLDTAIIITKLRKTSRTEGKENENAFFLLYLQIGTFTAGFERYILP